MRWLSALLLALVAAAATPAAAQRTLNVGPAVFSEGAGTWCVPVTASGPITQTASFRYQTTNGEASAVEDYAAKSGSQSVRKNTSKITVCGSLVDDAKFENDERFYFDIFPSTGSVVGTARAVITIRDNDPAPPPPTQTCPNGSVILATAICPAPTPAASALQRGMIKDGDSMSVPTYANASTWAAANGVPVLNVADTGGIIKGTCGLAALNCDADQIKASNFSHYVLAPFGRNDLMDRLKYKTPEDYARAEVAWLDSIAAQGRKIVVGTVFTLCKPSAPQDAINFNRDRKLSNAELIKLATVRGWGVINYDLVPEIANDAFNCDAANSSDGTHLTPAGYSKVYPVAKPVLDAAFGTEAVPTPLPTSEPTVPVTEPAPVVEPLLGETPIPSNFDRSAFLQPVPIPADAGIDPLGSFRFLCTPGQLLYDDPIVYPGQPGKSHLHQFYGNDGANAASTYRSLRETGNSGCMTPLNRSAYWMPAMLDGRGNVVRPDYIAIYYKRRPISDPKCSLSSGDPKAEGNCVELPNGLKFIFGYDMITGKSPTGELWFNCTGNGAVSGHYPTIEAAAANCVPGGRIGAVIKAPGCWDGKNLDSPNHRDHVAYAGYNNAGVYRCPSTHPYVIPGFTLQAWYSVQAGDDLTKWQLSSDEMRPTLPHGSTFHADFFMGWDPETKKVWHDNCLNKHLNCSDGVLGDGTMMKRPLTTYAAVPRLVSIPLAP